MVGDRRRARAGAHGGGADGSPGRRLLRGGPGARPAPPLGAGAVGSSVVRGPRASMGRVMAERALTARSPLSERAPEVIRLLKEAYPNATVALEFSNPLECLIAVILSAQSTDKKVNEVTEMLFRKYRTPEDYLRVPESELAIDLKPTGFFNQKTRAVRGACRMIVEEFDGRVPGSIAELEGLGGRDVDRRGQPRQAHQVDHDVPQQHHAER